MQGELKIMGSIISRGSSLFVPMCLKTPMKSLWHHLQHPSLDHASSVGQHKEREIVGLEQQHQALKEVVWMMMLKMF